MPFNRLVGARTQVQGGVVLQGFTGHFKVPEVGQADLEASGKDLRASAPLTFLAPAAAPTCSCVNNLCFWLINATFVSVFLTDVQ